MTGPYREGPSFLLCPRCGELLDRVFDDVLACMRCHGIFITPPTAGVAFEDPAWPKDASAMWWKSELPCPICAHAGADTIMAAQIFEGTQIDRCASHGLWLDAGELSRLQRTRGDELAYLRNKLHGDGDQLQLDAKREQWRRDVDARRRAAEEHDAWLAAERKRQIEEADRRQEEARIALEEQQRVTAALTATRPPSRELFDPPRTEPVALAEPPKPPPKPEPPRVPVRTWRETAVRQSRIDERRSEIVRVIGALESELTSLRMQVRELEGKLAGERARLRALIDEV